MKIITKDSKITLGELHPTEFGVLNGKPSYDEFSLLMKRLPSRALPTLEGRLRDEGYNDVQSINPYHHGINDGLSHENFRRFFSSEVVGLGSITRTAKQTLELTRRLKQVKPNIKVVLGGPHFTLKYEQGLESGADVVCIGEGEETLPKILETAFDPDKLQEIRGIVFWKGSEIIKTAPRELLKPDEFTHHPYYDNITRRKTNIGVVETSRGCPYNCDYCQVSEIFGRKFRNKNIDYIVEERINVDDIGKTFFYTADNIAGNKKRLIEFSYAIENRGLNKGFGICQITSKSLRDPEVVEALERMGIKMTCVGYEFVYDSSLKDIGKQCSAEDNNEACKILREKDIWNHGMIMTGGKDNEESLEYTTEWAIQNLDSAQFFPMGNLPGTAFDERMRAEGRVITEDESLADGHHVVVRADCLSPYEQQVLTDKMYYKFYSLKNNLRRLARSPNRALSLGIMIYTNIKGGLDKVTKSRQHLQHLEFLKSIS